MAQAEKITFKEFQKRFSSEDACRKFLYQQRFPNGFVCPNCGSTEYYLLLPFFLKTGLPSSSTAGREIHFLLALTCMIISFTVPTGAESLQHFVQRVKGDRLIKAGLSLYPELTP